MNSTIGYTTSYAYGDTQISLFADENEQNKSISNESTRLSLDNNNHNCNPQLHISNQEDDYTLEQQKEKRLRSTYPFGKCKVCQDKATGIHYGVATCEGCKGFFKRSTQRKEKYRCFFGNQCPLMPDNRNRCKACRFRTCLEVGMSIEGVKMGRIPKAEKERAIQEYQEKQYGQQEQEPSDPKQQQQQQQTKHTLSSDDEHTLSIKRLKAFANKTNTSYLNDSLLLTSNNQHQFLTNTPLPSYYTQFNYIPKCSSLSNGNVNNIFSHSIYSHVPTRSAFETPLVPIIKQKETCALSLPATVSIPLPPTLSLALPSIIHKEETTKIDKETLNQCIFNYSSITSPNGLLLKLAPINMDYIIASSANTLHSLHSKDMKSVRLLSERANHLIRYGATTFVGHDATIEMVWEGLVISIPQHVKALIVYAKELPGFSEIKNDDFAAIVNRRLFDFFIFKHAYLLLNDESFMMLPNNIQYTRAWMTKVIGHEMVQAMFDFAKLFHDCKISERELSILLPYVLTSPANHLLRENYRLDKLHDFYTKILIHEMNMNKRSPEFLNKLSFILAQLPMLHELETRSIRAISPQM